MTRAVCARCLRPERTCLCAWITPVANQVEVLVLQHPLEVGHAKGSATLLRHSLQTCHLLVGERLDAATLQAVFERPTAAQSLSNTPGRPVNVLLYPEDQDGAQAGAMPPCTINHLPSLRLIVLDGTWRKSRKMLHLNPLLAGLPRLALPPDAPSRYLIRKAHRPGQLSTLEATCLGLSQLEQAPARYLPLQAAFDGFVAAQGSLWSTGRSG